MMLPNDLVFRLRKRAEIRRQITTRKSVQNNEPDRIADLLEEAANEIEALKIEAALQRLSDFTQEYDAKKHGAEE
jgi:phosphopantetheine adenylyltransferase